MKGVFLDIETTGLDPFRHRPIDLAFQIRNLETGALLGTYQSLVRQSSTVWKEGDPSSLEIHRYTFEEVQQGKEAVQIAEEIIALFGKLEIVRGKAFFICQNPAFDRGFFSHIVPPYTQESLHWPYHWLDLASMHWTTCVQTLSASKKSYPYTMNLSKNAIAKAHGIPPEDKPHHAARGVQHLVACYQAVMGLEWPSAS